MINCKPPIINCSRFSKITKVKKFPVQNLAWFMGIRSLLIHNYNPTHILYKATPLSWRCVWHISRGIQEVFHKFLKLMGLLLCLGRIWYALGRILEVFKLVMNVMQIKHPVYQVPTRVTWPITLIVTMWNRTWSSQTCASALIIVPIHKIK
jgi:hypothetical protein